VSHHALELGFRGLHREPLEVQRRLVLIANSQDLRPEVRPVARHAVGTIEAADAHLSIAARQDEQDIGAFAPGIHVQQDALPELGRRPVQEAHGQPGARDGPAKFAAQSEAARAAATTWRSAQDDAASLRIRGVELRGPFVRVLELRPCQLLGRAGNRCHNNLRAVFGSLCSIAF
jgi:hypothetical protein